jgi:hypothetical protein
LLVAKSRLKAYIAVASTLAIATSCMVSDPREPPIGAHYTSGAILLHVPLCKGERITELRVYGPPESGSDDENLIWTGKQPIASVSAQGLIHLGRMKEFRDTSGPFREMAFVGIEVDTDQSGRQGTIHTQFERTEIPRDLVSDTFWTGGDPPTMSQKSWTRPLMWTEGATSDVTGRPYTPMCEHLRMWISRGGLGRMDSATSTTEEERLEPRRVDGSTSMTPSHRSTSWAIVPRLRGFRFSSSCSAASSEPPPHVVLAAGRAGSSPSNPSDGR